MATYDGTEYTSSDAFNSVRRQSHTRNQERVHEMIEADRKRIEKTNAEILERIREANTSVFQDGIETMKIMNRREQETRRHLEELEQANQAELERLRVEGDIKVKAIQMEAQDYQQQLEVETKRVVEEIERKILEETYRKRAEEILKQYRRAVARIGQNRKRFWVKCGVFTLCTTILFAAFLIFVWYRPGQQKSIPTPTTPLLTTNPWVSSTPTFEYYNFTLPYINLQRIRGFKR